MNAGPALTVILRRDTDQAGEGVRELGGLCVIGTERHENRRIDNQPWTFRTSRIQVRSPILLSLEMNWCAVSILKWIKSAWSLQVEVKKDRSSTLNMFCVRWRVLQNGLKSNYDIISKSFNTMTWWRTTGRLSAAERYDVITASKWLGAWNQGHDQTDHQTVEGKPLKQEERIKRFWTLWLIWFRKIRFWKRYWKENLTRKLLITYACRRNLCQPC